MVDKNRSDLIKPAQRGMLRDVLLNLKLILRLMGDRRVNPFLKVLPLASLAYFVLPLPIEMALPLVDDAAIVWLGSYLFLELCPPTVVQEHRKQLSSNLEDEQGTGEVVDAETTDLTDKP